ncbi:hypothetical protein [Cohnella rhizosphaerae]|uniref:Uncharacterized protein n=1 Tax=Cohnella rhizosphaerae TaxID=1457232 RepID=A0A9X4KMZ6_9BACL|nr:hypothetical protein [Cohnella rhizosphaerae]MDG0807996.1 hypothetical protein [Cohnella rhizosphaerae]
MRKGKSATAVLAGVMLLGAMLSACGGNNNNGNASPSGTATAGASSSAGGAASPSATAKAEDEVTLKFYFGGDKKGGDRRSMVQDQRLCQRQGTERQVRHQLYPV